MYIGKFLKRREGILKPNPILSKMNNRFQKENLCFTFFELVLLEGNWYARKQVIERYHSKASQVS